MKATIAELTPRKFYLVRIKAKGYGAFNAVLWRYENMPHGDMFALVDWLSKRLKRSFEKSMGGSSTGIVNAAMPLETKLTIIREVRFEFKMDSTPIRDALGYEIGRTYVRRAWLDGELIFENETSTAYDLSKLRGFM